MDEQKLISVYPSSYVVVTLDVSSTSDEEGHDSILGVEIPTDERDLGIEFTTKSFICISVVGFLNK